MTVRIPSQRYQHNLVCVLHPVSLDGTEGSNLYSARSTAEKGYSKPEKKSKIIKTF